MTPPSDLTAEQIALKELAVRALTRRRLLYFIRRFHPDYQPGWVHAEICERLERFAQDILEKKSPRLMLMMPPRLGKSTIASQYFPAWLLGNYPAQEVISCSYALSLQLAFSRKIRTLLEDPQYVATFSGAGVSEEARNVEGWRTQAGGGFKPAGRGGPINGFGASCLIIDDLLKNAQEASSDSTRDSAWEWYVSTARTRLAPGGGVLVVGTRWHWDDPMGRLEGAATLGDEALGDVFEVVRYPALAMEDETHRKQGEALHPERYSQRDLETIRATVGPNVWNALYQQNPTADTGGYFDTSWFRYYDVPPPLETLRVFMAWDLAIGKRERNDWTVGVVAGLSETGDLYILDVLRGRWDALEIADTILDAHVRFKSFICGIEQGQLSMAIRPILNARIEERKLYDFALQEMPPGRRDKETRARSLQGRMRQGRVYCPDKAAWFPDFLAEFQQFPHGRHDDQCDAAAYVALLLEQVPQPVNTPQTPAKPAWMSRVLASMQEAMSHMTA